MYDNANTSNGLPWNKDSYGNIEEAWTALKPLLYCFITLFSVNDTKYPNRFFHDFEDHPVIPNPQLPIAAECFSQGFTIKRYFV
jgi:hypothetical protein